MVCQTAVSAGTKDKGNMLPESIVKAVQEQRAMIEELKTGLKALQKQNVELFLKLDAVQRPKTGNH
jgi:sensor histidine kinase regulating citrate/malate metabolism